MNATVNAPLEWVKTSDTFSCPREYAAVRVVGRAGGTPVLKGELLMNNQFRSAMSFILIRRSRPNGLCIGLETLDSSASSC